MRGVQWALHFMKGRVTMAVKRIQNPAIDPEAREKQLINQAYDLAERQLQAGTASPSVITHFLKLATKKEELEREILEKQKTLMEAKTENLTKDYDTKRLTEEAINAMSKYRSSEQ